MSDKMEMQTVDMILFGGALLFMASVFLLLSGKKEDKKLEQRVRAIKKGGASRQIKEQALSLSKKQDNSLGAMGIRMAGRLQTAGLNITVLRYVLLCSGILAFFVLVIAVIVGKSLLLALLIGFIIGFGIPHLYVGMRIKKRQQQFLRLFPDAIELIVRGLRAGLPVAESMQNVAHEIPEPVGSAFEDLCDQLKLGVPFDKAMSNVAQRLGLTEFNFFMVSVIMQRETGGNLGEILSNLADVLRRRHIMKLKINALSSEARASAYVVGALPILVVLVLSVVSADYMKPLLEDSRGNMAAGIAVCSLCIGSFIMARMTRFQI